MSVRNRYRLRLVIDQVTDEQTRSWPGESYDLDNAKPWPLGIYNTKREAIAQRNFMVMIDPPATGDPARDKAISDGIQSKARAVQRRERPF